ncbi:SCO1664 family protein [Longispora albida]|uniref:SCO1664 family protein n=1 Tax=Longispora albida TaxID=203523 RepID=UPI00036E0461|nr:SCO1664 family protein [Longispora albida]
MDAAKDAAVDPLELLRHGDLELEGRLTDASNATLRAYITLDGETARCVYKPVAGERPLWDFPDGTLAGREVAAYLVSEATGWECVPPTVLRDGPFGPGSCQLWIEEVAPPLVDFVPELPAGWHPIASARGGVLGHADEPGLAKLAAYDAVINNADRKGGHLLRAAGGHVYGIDHGICFHAEDKLRTVLWGWAGQELPGEVTGVLQLLRTGLTGDLGTELARHLTPAEVQAAASRVERLLASGRYPLPSEEWPPLPWPAL